MDSNPHDDWYQAYDGECSRGPPGRVDYFRFYKLAARAPVTGSAKAVLWALAHRTNSDPENQRFGTCKVSIAGLASLAGVSERTSRRAINELEGLGIVIVEGERRGGARASTANVYRLTPTPVTVTPLPLSQ